MLSVAKYCPPRPTAGALCPRTSSDCCGPNASNPSGQASGNTSAVSFGSPSDSLALSAAKAWPTRLGAPPSQVPSNWKASHLANAAPCRLHPFGASFVRLGHALSQYSAQLQVFVDGLLGVSTPNLLPTQHAHNHAMAAMSQRLFEIRTLSGEAGAQERHPMPQDIDNAAAALAQQRTVRAWGEHLNRGIWDAAAWCARWRD